MAWLLVDDGFFDHPKVMEAGGDAALLYLAALAWSSRQLTDGVIPRAAVGRLTDRKAPTRLAQRLVAVRLWEEVDGGWRIHDYEDFNPSAEDVRQRRDAARVSRRTKATNAARARWSHARGDAPSMLQASDDACSEHLGSNAWAMLGDAPQSQSSSNKSSSVTRAVLPEGAEEEDEAPPALTQAAAEVAERRLRHQPAGSVRSPARWRQRVAQGALAELRSVDGWQSMTVEQLADVVEPRPPNPHPRRFEQHVDPLPDPNTTRNGLRAARAAKGGSYAGSDG